jgi:hypothetical protein
MLKIMFFTIFGIVYIGVCGYFSAKGMKFWEEYDEDDL